MASLLGIEGVLMPDYRAGTVSEGYRYVKGKNSDWDEKALDGFEID
jgi:hypothetical protein